MSFIIEFLSRGVIFNGGGILHETHDYFLQERPDFYMFCDYQGATFTT